ncbi:MAG TPA: acyl carrier protein [Anaerolineae bacterium]|nr:acyl carrier protein [Anaerolineae bacterium]
MITTQTPIRAADDIFDRVKMILSDQLGVGEEQINPWDNLREDLGADSLDLIELIMALVQEFGREVFDEDARTIQTVGEIVAYIEQRYSPGKVRLESAGAGSVLNELPCLKFASDTKEAK